MSEVMFEPGQEVAIDFGAKRSKGLVEEVHGDKVSITRAPGARLPKPAKDASISFLKVTNGGVFHTQATVISTTDSGFLARLESAKNRVQRRRYLRIEEPLSVHALILETNTNRFHGVDAELTDVSGGGVAMRANAIAPQGTIVVMSISIPGDSPVVAIGTALASDREDRAVLGEDGRKLRVSFTNIAEADRDRLIRHILQVDVSLGTLRESTA